MDNNQNAHKQDPDEVGARMEAFHKEMDKDRPEETVITAAKRPTQYVMPRKSDDLVRG